MALNKDIKPLILQTSAKHSYSECTFSVAEEGGRKLLQLEKYGFSGRQIPEKKNQSLRFTPEARLVLKQIIQNNGL
jgi:hypothetical protein